MNLLKCDFSKSRKISKKVLTKQIWCGIIDRHSSRERKTKDPTDGESSGFSRTFEAVNTT